MTFHAESACCKLRTTQCSHPTSSIYWCSARILNQGTPFGVDSNQCWRRRPPSSSFTIVTMTRVCSSRSSVSFHPTFWTLGDDAAKQNHNSKLSAQRGGEPTFDVIIELDPGELHTWRVVTNVGEAVDSILKGNKYKAQTRTRDPSDGSMSLLLGEF